VNKVLAELQPLLSETYEGIGLDLLTIYAVGEVSERNIDLSYENIVVAAFRLFPKKFSLLGYPPFPDSERVHHVLRRHVYTKDPRNQWLRGKFAHGFELIERGREVLQEARQALAVTMPQHKKVLSHTRRFEKILDEVRRSPAYLKFLQGKCDLVSEAECCQALQGTLDSNRQVLLDNLRQLRTIANDLEQSDVVEFLNWLDDRFGTFLSEGISR
jgi:hypothetical protein